MYKDRYFKYLFIFNKQCDDHNEYWTMRGDYTSDSIKYRLPKHRKAYGMEDLDEIAVIECKDDMEPVDLQRAMNEIFKPYQRGGGSRIKIDMKPETFIKYLNIINEIKYDDDKVYQVFKYVTSKYEYEKSYGDIYFVECANNKLKIGESWSFEDRWTHLKNEEQNMATDIIDWIRVKDCKYVEAELHILCRNYKTDGNKVRTNDKVSKNLSELFRDCEFVRNIWTDYWNKYTGYKSRTCNAKLIHLRTGKWPRG